jgi:hypothetical protein
MAISKVLSFTQGIRPGMVTIAGSFDVDALGVVTDVKIKDTAVTNTGAGVYELVLPGQGSVELSSAACQALSVGLALPFAVVVTGYTAATRTLEITCVDFAGAPVALGATESVHVTLVVNNSKAL